MFGTGASRDYTSLYNFDCSQWFLRIGMRTGDCPSVTFCILWHQKLFILH